MCGRFSLRSRDVEWAALFPEVPFPLFEPRPNVAPTQPILAVRMNDARVREAVWLRWGLVPSWANAVKTGYSLFNARSEEAAEKPSFRTALRRRRCLILADGFYEWETVGKRKTPHRFRRPDGAPLTLAGLWERWERDGAVVESATILTTQASADVAFLHDRMPVLLGPSDFATWLDPSIQDPGVVRELLRPDPGRLAVDRLDDGIPAAAGSGAAETD